MGCTRHGLATGPDGRCALCHRTDRAVDCANVRQDDRRIHPRLRVLIALAACVAAYATLMAWLDTAPPRRGPSGTQEEAPPSAR